MIGDGDDLPNYKRQAERLGLAARIRFHPPMPARQGFALGRVIVVPSRAEAMPYIVLEALAAGKTMIATTVGGIPEIFPQGSPALVEPSVAGVRDAMVAAMRDEAGFARNMPSDADLRSRFGADVMATQVEKAYFTSLGKRG